MFITFLKLYKWYQIAQNITYMIAVYHTWFEENEILTCRFTPTIKTRVTKKMYQVINFIQWLEENTQTTFPIKMWSNMFQLPSFNFICLDLHKTDSVDFRNVVRLSSDVFCFKMILRKFISTVSFAASFVCMLPELLLGS